LTLSSYSVLRSGAGALQESHRLAEEAVAMARRLDDPNVLAATLASSVLVHLSMDFPEKHAPIREEIDRLCAEEPSLGDELAGFRAWVVAACMSLMGLPRLGAGDRIDEGLLEARRRMEDDPQPMHRVMYHLAASHLQARRGDADGALEHGRQANDAGTKAQNLALQVLGGVARLHGLLAAGRYDEARQQFESTLPLSLRHMRQSAAVWVFPLLAELELREGNAEAAREAAERGIEMTQSMGFQYSEARNTLQLARAFVAGGKIERAEETLARVSELAATLEARDLPAHLEEARAELAARRGDPEAAARAWREAARRHRENGEEWLATQAEARIAS
jgi:ATP/maltotriose-dependent transcriptional regulator MalT